MEIPKEEQSLRLFAHMEVVNLDKQGKMIVLRVKPLHFSNENGLCFLPVVSPQTKIFYPASSWAENGLQLSLAPIGHNTFGPLFSKHSSVLDGFPILF